MGGRLPICIKISLLVGEGRREERRVAASEDGRYGRRGVVEVVLCHMLYAPCLLCYTACAPLLN